MPNKRIAVVYHRYCPDGFGAAWAAWKKFGDGAEYLPVDPEVLPNVSLRGRELYVLDNSYPVPVLDRLVRMNKRVTIIDHHASARECVKRATVYVFDEKHSGSVLAWRYFHPGKKVPQLLLYIEDIDLWRFRRAHTREIIAALELENFSFQRWSKVAASLERAGAAKQHIARGKIALRYQEQLVSRLVESAEPVRFFGYRTLAVNTPMFSSEVGTRLVKLAPPIGITWRAQGNEMCVSLRSNGTVDVSRIAGRFGGGGHRAASGFCIPAGQPFPWKRIQKKRRV